jgi:FAD/FMN-containing dehydrogenase
MEIEIDNDEEALENILEKSFENGLIEDALVSTSSRDFQEIWGLRENISESLAAYGHVRKNDVSVTVSQLALFLNEIDQLIKQSNLQIEIITFGHAGDGNVHINYVAPSETPIEIFEQQAVNIEEKIFLLLSKYKGSISAEHGVGLLKKKDLGLTRSALEIDYMRQIKKVFDPKGILNPGKIF